MTKNGASTLILTADNSYAGGTTINTGTLQVGNGGATGSVGTGPVLDDAALVFNRSGTVAVPGAITGTGSLTQEGVAGGTLVLTGANTYAGGTTIASGVLQLGDGGTSGSIVGNVADSGDACLRPQRHNDLRRRDLRRRGGVADRVRHDHSDWGNTYRAARRSRLGHSSLAMAARPAASSATSSIMARSPSTTAMR